MMSDRELAYRIARGDTQAWDEFFEAYFPWAYRFAYRHLGRSRADAEDLCSDILMTAARSIRRFDPSRGTLDLWLLGIARHRLARFCRKRRTECPLVFDPAELPDNPEASIPAEALDAAFTREAVNRALASLPQRQAAVLVGKYVAGYSVEELARTQGVTPKAVESLLSRARASFRLAFAKLREGVSGGDCGG
jgi:RNA polymerase sigma-70 factor (ECF subfamily)